jgi:hypothetical protein
LALLSLKRLQQAYLLLLLLELLWLLWWKQHQLGYVPELEVGEIAFNLQYSLDHPQTTKEMGVQAHQLVQENTLGSVMP